MTGTWRHYIADQPALPPAPMCRQHGPGTVGGRMLWGWGDETVCVCRPDELRTDPAYRAGQVRPFVFPVIAAATEAGRWMAAVRRYNDEGRLIRVTVLGGYGQSWDDAATDARSFAASVSHPVRYQ
jgi:hypothetical protein